MEHDQHMIGFEREERFNEAFQLLKQQCPNIYKIKTLCQLLDIVNPNICIGLAERKPCKRRLKYIGEDDDFLLKNRIYYSSDPKWRKRPLVQLKPPQRRKFATPFTHPFQHGRYYTSILLSKTKWHKPRWFMSSSMASCASMIWALAGPTLIAPLHCSILSFQNLQFLRYLCG